jgi:hypothetical protein
MPQDCENSQESGPEAKPQTLQYGAAVMVFRDSLASGFTTA